ncbi:hypothetical protein EUTSA_v10023105mg [Eutrema salsugineum]|uniref:Jacalin-type lectin domain-containing protein n=1 Tax=Eutrema salsugineum TaxID=72664 RepID=V4MEB2_EUTSA|nr:hypothetical protein EUTSA_v10023105mg [Eutrema salsugineum]
MFKVGPTGRKEWFDETWDEKGRIKISNISVSFDDYNIRSIQFSYFHKAAQVVSKKYGSSKAQYFQIVSFDSIFQLTGERSGIFKFCFCKILTFCF